MKTVIEYQLYLKDFYRNTFIFFQLDTKLLVTNCIISSCETKTGKVVFPLVLNQYNEPERRNEIHKMN